MIKYQLLDNSEVIAFNDYYKGKKYAEDKGLILAEYGDVYGTSFSYCYFNKSGNRNDTEEVIIYYRFGKNGKPTPITEEELKRYLFN